MASPIKPLQPKKWYDLTPAERVMNLTENKQKTMKPTKQVGHLGFLGAEVLAHHLAQAGCTWPSDDAFLQGYKDAMLALVAGELGTDGTYIQVKGSRRGVHIEEVEGANGSGQVQQANGHAPESLQARLAKVTVTEPEESAQGGTAAKSGSVVAGTAAKSASVGVLPRDKLEAARALYTGLGYTGDMPTNVSGFAGLKGGFNVKAMAELGLAVEKQARLWTKSGRNREAKDYKPKNNEHAGQAVFWHFME